MNPGEFHPDVKRLLDGELRLDELPAALRAEGEEALRLLQAVDRGAVRMPAAIGTRVMTAVRGRRRFRRLALVPLAAAAVALVVLLGRGRISPPSPPAAGLTAVRFVLVAPEARAVTLAGTFNHWDATATPLLRTGAAGVWSATITLPAGEYEYAFLVDGVRWVPDPAAPAVDDRFGAGRRNSVLTL